MPLSPLQFQQMLRAADATHHAGNFPEAIAQARQLIRQAPDRGETYMVLSAALLGLGDAAGARQAAADGLRVRPGNAALLYALSRAYLRLNRLPEAERAIDSALAQRPAEGAFLSAKADILLSKAEPQAAYDLLSAAPGPGFPGLVSALARAASQIGRHSEAIDHLRRALSDEGLSAAARSNLLYDLGETLDAVGEYDSAFVTFREANDLKRYPYDADAESRAIDAMIRAWTPAVIAALPRAKKDPRPAFIVGFWRSGTTLVEQTLSSHPRVFGAGELDYLPRAADGLRDPRFPSAEPMIADPARLTRSVVERVSRGYLGLLRTLDKSAARVTDKMPTNFLHLGIIATALPGAPVIHCLRDPVDTCLSCYFNMRGNMTYAHDLADLGRFYRDYQRLIAHWKSVLDLPVLDVRYEEFVGAQEATARRMVAFLGLDWDDACLRPHENARVAMTRSMDQVRKPMYSSSVARWRRYERHLGPLLSALGREIG